MITAGMMWLRRYTVMTGHKLVGLMYGYTGYCGGLYGFYLSVWMRMEIGSQGLGVVRKVKEVYVYNGWITGHGLVMLFLFVMPIAIGGYGNYILPMLIGTSELVMPRMNGVSYWMLFMATITMMTSQVIYERPASAGWTLYPPLVTRDGESGTGSTDMSIVCMHMLGVSSGLSAMNFMATMKHGRHRGLTMMGCNLYVWAIGITSLLLIGALPVLGVGVTGLLMDRNVMTGIYDGVLGGDPILYQHFFWFFGHPEVYIIIVPIFGIVSCVIGSITHKEVFGKEGMVYCMGAIGIIGFSVWAHHMFTVGLDVDSRAYFSVATAVIAIPTSVKVFSYMASFSGGTGLKGSSAVAGFWSFLICFTIGGFTGLVLSSVAIDIVLHDTYFVVGHFHTVLSLGAVFGIMIGHYQYMEIWSGGSTMEGKGLNEVIGVLIGAIMVFGPMHGVGMKGMSRRIPEYADVYWPYMQVGTTGIMWLVMSVIWIIRGMYMVNTTVVSGGMR